MKNKIVTLICIIAIVATTAIVALANQTNPTYVNSNDNGDPVQSELISQHVYNKADVELADEYTEPIYPKGEIYRQVKVENLSQQHDVLVKTVFVFEAGDISDMVAFNKVFDISFSTDKNNWTLKNDETNWTINNEWEFVQYGGKNYVMTSATYDKPLIKHVAGSANSYTEPLFVKVEMLDTVTNEMTAQFADRYELLITSYAVQAEGWTVNNNPVNLAETDVVGDILDQVVGVVGTNYVPEWDKLAPYNNY